MRLSDIMSQMGLASYAEVGLVLFLGAFIAITVRTLLTPKQTASELAAIPLDDAPASASNRSRLIP